MFKNHKNINRLRYFNNEKNSYMPYYNIDDYPDFLTLKQQAFERAIKAGFSIEQTSPSNANCIIRLFSNKLRTKNQLGYIQMIYGFNFYTKTLNKWFTRETRYEEFEINFSKHEYRVWYFQDEYEDYECDFIDCYVKIS